ncbi:MAG: polymerase sigma-54 factor [Candidatus Eremiobacteraeota bacterium]|nr:polymerase sigma-54 factor [Candidatus Eremiobacteraeota bacterium]
MAGGGSVASGGRPTVSVGLALRTELRVAPALVTFATLLPLDVEALEAYIERERAANPWLERRESGFDAEAVARIADRPRLSEHLAAQLAARELAPPVRRAAAAIVGSLDGDGYLREPLEAIGALARALPADVERALRAVQGCEPAGVGARGLGERLLLQACAEGVLDADVEALCAHVEALAAGGVARVAADTGRDPEALRRAFARLATLDRDPLRDFAPPVAFARPELIFSRADGDPTARGRAERGGGSALAQERGGWSVALDPGAWPALEIAPLGATEGGAFAAARRRALALVDALERRRLALVRIGEVLAQRQAAYLASGARADLAPLRARDVARDAGLADSTVSRALSSRWARTPHGVVPLRAFLRDVPRGLTVATDDLRARIRALAQRDEALSDAQIARMLGFAGIRVARRTVTKHRRALALPAARQRTRDDAERDRTSSWAAAPERSAVPERAR